MDNYFFGRGWFGVKMGVDGMGLRVGGRVLSFFLQSKKIAKTPGARWGFLPCGCTTGQQLRFSSSGARWFVVCLMFRKQNTILLLSIRVKSSHSFGAL